MTPGTRVLSDNDSAHARHYPSQNQRRDALTGWIHEYNHHRPHSATEGKPPISRLTNVPGRYS